MNSPVTALTCPKCQGIMRTYERGGVHVDQCSDCRGIFLDRGELEHLMDAETGFYGNQHEQRPRQQHHKKKRGGFLGDMFDFG
jgi:Zn-finger nucleic acid-binding protein